MRNSHSGAVISVCFHIGLIIMFLFAVVIYGSLSLHYFYCLTVMDVNILYSGLHMLYYIFNCIRMIFLGMLNAPLRINKSGVD